MNNSSSDRLAGILRAWLESAPAGARLPSTRELMRQHGVGPATVRAAIAALSAQGLVVSRPGDGTYAQGPRREVVQDHGWQAAALGPAPGRAFGGRPALTDAAPEHLNLAEGYPEPSLLPLEAVRTALRRASRGDEVGSRSPAAGLPELRSWIAADLAARSPRSAAAPSARDVMVLPGSQSGLAAIFRAVVGAGRPLLIETPTYWGAILAASQVGVVLVPVASGPHGPDPDEVDRAFAATGARAFYAQPTFANPHGGVWDDLTRRRIGEVAARHGAFVVEDEWAADLAMERTPAPLAALDTRGAVIGLRSFTKSVSPALRVAALTARGPVRARLLAEVQAQALYVSPVLQRALLDVLASPAWSTHRRRLPGLLAERRDLLAAALSRHAPDLTLVGLPRGGLNLWARLPEHVAETDVARACSALGLEVFAGARAFPSEPDGGYLRLNFASTPPTEFDRAAALLGRALATAGATGNR